VGDLTNISACPNCGHEPFDTPFCPECGQRRLSEKDFSIYSLTGDFFHGVLNLENSFFNTLKDFFLRPSKYLDEYNHGARKKYISPIKLFLVANAFYFLFPAINTFTTSLRIQMNGLLYSNFMRGFIQGRITASELNAEQFHTEYNELTATLSKALLLFLPLVFGLITWLLSFTKTKKAPLIFHINRSLGLHAFILFIVVSIVPGVFYYTAHILQSDIPVPLLPADGHPWLDGFVSLNNHSDINDVISNTPLNPLSRGDFIDDLIHFSVLELEELPTIRA
jgi:hypothetical protein